MNGRIAGTGHRARPFAALAATATLFMLVATASPGAAPAADRSADRPIEVGPGIFLAPASELADPVVAPAITGAAPEARSAPTDAASRVVGGTKAKISRWPWQVSIGYLPIAPNNAFKNHSCGGTLVAPKVVVTAAHCMTLGPNRNFRPPEEFQVVSGRTVLSSDKGSEHALADYFWFVDGNGEPLWNPTTLEWDVVFLLLDTPSSREPIKIAGPGEEAVWTPGRRAFATGWGSTKAGTDAELDARQSDVLRQARIRTISDSTCDSVYGPILVTEVMVCAGDLAGGVDVCSGDSGGPLVVPIAGKGADGYRLIGDTSFADGCGVPGIPGVYGRLASDPIRGSLQEGIEAIAGVDVLGSEAIPSSRFGFGRRSHRSDRGTARLTVRVPGRGQVRLQRSRRVRGAVTWPAQAGRVRLPVRPRFHALRRLGGGESGATNRIRVKARVTYSPLGGKPRTRTARIWLVKRS